MISEVINIFEIPKIVESIIDKIISKDEKELIILIKGITYSQEQLTGLVINNLQIKPDEFIKNCYKRNILDKEIIGNNVFYKTSNMYCRLSVFAQYEPDAWQSIDKNLRKSIDEWYVKEYAKRSIEKVEKLESGEINPIENAYFITLEESLKLLEYQKNDIYLLPCNCKSLAKNCNKPTNVCIQFENGINTMVDRGWGDKISKERAKEIVIKANKSGLMHSSECESALCNCDGCCCYPIRAARILGVEKQWPKKVHKIIWNKDRCIHCGKCSKMCNFDAFEINNKITSFDDEKCWGCTICKDNCPTKAITLEY